MWARIQEDILHRHVYSHKGQAIKAKNGCAISLNCLMIFWIGYLRAGDLSERGMRQRKSIRYLTMQHYQGEIPPTDPGANLGAQQVLANLQPPGIQVSQNVLRVHVM